MLEEKWAEKQLTKEQAVAMFDSEVYNNWDAEKIVRFQLFQRRLCMPFEKFHQAVGKVLKRAVFTHEFGSRDNLVLEYLGEREMPTMDEIINLISEEKRIIIEH